MFDLDDNINNFINQSDKKYYNNIQPRELYKIEDRNVHVNLSKPAELQRDKAFIYLNDHIYIALSHPAAFEKITNLSAKKKQLYLIYRFKRIPINTNDKISFGHILNGNIAVIDSYTNLNCEDEDVKNALLSVGIKKVYSGYTPGFKLKEIDRIAKK